MRKQGSCLEKEIMQGTMPGARRRGRPRMAWVDKIKMWTGLSVEESIRMTEDRDKWRNYVHGVTNPRIEDGSRTEQNRTLHCCSFFVENRRKCNISVKLAAVQSSSRADSHKYTSGGGDFRHVIHQHRHTRSVHEKTRPKCR